MLDSLEHRGTDQGRTASSSRKSEVIPVEQGEQHPRRDGVNGQPEEFPVLRGGGSLGDCQNTFGAV